jgi:hypothetical protein
LSDIPEEIIVEYNLRKRQPRTVQWVYIHVEYGVYGLPQAGSLGLIKERYRQNLTVPGVLEAQYIVNPNHLIS